MSDLKRGAHYARVADALERWPWYNDPGLMQQLCKLVPPAARTFLDLGCGPGLFAEFLCAHQRYESLVAADICPEMTVKAKARLSNFRNTDVVVSNWTDAVPEGVLYDCIILKNVLHTLADPIAKILELQSTILKSTGTILICESISVDVHCDAFMKGLFQKINREGFRKRRYTADTLEQLLAQAGLTPITKKKVRQRIDLDRWLNDKAKTRGDYLAAKNYFVDGVRNAKLKKALQVKFSKTGMSISMLRLQYLGNYTFNATS